MVERRFDYLVERRFDCSTRLKEERRIQLLDMVERRKNRARGAYEDRERGWGRRLGRSKIARAPTNSSAVKRLKTALETMAQTLAGRWQNSKHGETGLEKEGELRGKQEGAKGSLVLHL